MFREREDLFLEAVRNYVIALVGAMETFYRDLFVHFYAEKPDVVSEIISQLRPKGRHPSLVHERFTAAEVASVVLSFQRLEEIDAAISPLIEANSYFQAITKFSIVCGVPSRSPNIGHIRLSAEWKHQLAELLELRHRYVHDANYVCEMRREFIAEAESMMLALGQLTSFMLGAQEEKMPEANIVAFLLIEDLIAEDWVVCDEPKD